MSWYVESKISKSAMGKWWELIDTITLYHGTSSDFLPIILDKGIMPIDPEDMVDKILLRFGLNRETAPEWTWKSELHFRGDKKNGVWLCTSKDTSASYSRSAAKGAGEFESSIVNNLNGWLSDSGKLPILMKVSQPIVVTVDVPWSIVKTVAGLGFDGLKKVVERVRADPTIHEDYDSFEEFFETVSYDFRSETGIPREYIISWEGA